MSSESRHPALTFDDVQIRQLFGSEDAENEDSARFKEYFVRNRAYENLVADLPLRILVGHKGVGKSALLRHAYEKDLSDGILAVFLKPDDLSALLRSAGEGDINSRIDAWKSGIKSATCPQPRRPHFQPTTPDQ